MNRSVARVMLGISAIQWLPAWELFTLSGHPADWDLAIVDLFLKQGSGLGVLEACQGRRGKQRVVVLSNYATEDMRKRCAQLGADAVFDKSNEIDALVEYCMQQSAPSAPAR